MDVYAMAEVVASLAGPRATVNTGRKSAAYKYARNDLIALVGLKWARELLKEAFASRMQGLRQ